jgi:chlorobactene glucosyltransferase
VELALSIFWLLAAVWLIYRAVRQSEALPTIVPAEPPRAETAPAVAVIVPARNEADNIATCVRALANQRYPAERLRSYVVDDQSSDGTGAIVADLAARGAPVTLLQSPPLPPGWIGKPHACWVGVQAVPAGVDWLCFIDADVRLDARAIASAVAAAERDRLDFLSLAPAQELVSFAERLVMPCGLYLLAFMQELDRIQAPDSDDATATGQFMLVRRAAYDAIGGHAAVRGIIAEDVALARVMKRAGRRVALLGGDGMLRARMYTGWRTLWPGLAKNVVDMMGGPVPTVLTAFGGMTLAWLAIAVPLIDLAVLERAPDSAAIAALALASAASCAAFGLHLAGALYLRIPVWYGLLFPLGYSAGALIALDSVRRRLTGRVAWKGRTYP